MIWIGLVAIIVTITAALVEARGYIYSFAAFKEGFNPNMLALSFAWYTLGIALDYSALYLLSKSTIFIPELLAVIFMVSTLIAIAILSGEFMKWQRIDQGVAVLIVIGLAWLTYRVGK